MFILRTERLEGYADDRFTKKRALYAQHDQNSSVYSIISSYLDDSGVRMGHLPAA